MSVPVTLGRKCTLAASCADLGESRWACGARSVMVRKRWDRRTDGRTPDRYITLTDRRGQRNNMGCYTI